MNTSTIRLRRWREDDAEALYRLASEKELGERGGWPVHQSVEQSRQVLRDYFMNDETWAVERLATHELIGCMGYLTASMSHLNIKDDEAEVGYWIGKPFWNNGYATEALQLLVDHCLTQKRLTALWGTHFLSNPSSGRVMEKCGFTEVERETLSKDYEQPVRVLRLKL